MQTSNETYEEYHVLSLCSDCSMWNALLLRPTMTVKQDLRDAVWENPSGEENCEHKKRMLMASGSDTLETKICDTLQTKLLYD